MADFISRVLQILVTLIDCKRQLFLRKIRKHFRARTSEQWANDPTISHQGHPRQSTMASAAQQTEQYGFSLIIGSMRYSNSIEAMENFCLMKKTVPRLPRPGFDAAVCRRRNKCFHQTWELPLPK